MSFTNSSSEFQEKCQLTSGPLQRCWNLILATRSPDDFSKSVLFILISLSWLRPLHSDWFKPNNAVAKVIPKALQTFHPHSRRHPVRAYLFMNETLHHPHFFPSRVTPLYSVLEQVGGSITSIGCNNNNNVCDINYTLHRAPVVPGGPRKFHAEIITLVYTLAAHIRSLSLCFPSAFDLKMVSKVKAGLRSRDN